MFSEDSGIDKNINNFSPIINISNNDVSKDATASSAKQPIHKRLWLLVLGVLGFFGLIFALINDGFSVFDRFNKPQGPNSNTSKQDTVVLRKNKGIK